MDVVAETTLFVNTCYGLCPIEETIDMLENLRKRGSLPASDMNVTKPKWLLEQGVIRYSPAEDVYYPTSMLDDFVGKLIENSFREHRYARVCWTIDDVKELKPEWSDARCADFLFKNEGAIQDAMCSAGWDAIKELLAYEEEKSAEDGAA